MRRRRRADRGRALFGSLSASDGCNVYPAEIERVLAGLPAVAMSAVGRVADDRKGELAKAYIVLKPGASANPDDVMAFCREHLAAY